MKSRIFVSFASLIIAISGLVLAESFGQSPSCQGQLINLPYGHKAIYQLKEIAEILSKSSGILHVIDVRCESRKILIITSNNTVQITELKELLEGSTNLKWRTVNKTNFLTYYNDNEILKLAENTKNKLENLRNSISSVLEGDNHISGVKNWEKLSEQDKIRNISMMSKIGGADSEIFRQITQNPQMLQGATIKYSLSLDISVGTGLPGDGGSKTAYRIY